MIDYKYIDIPYNADEDVNSWQAAYGLPWDFLPLYFM
jgi:hypothetical protein